MTIVVLILLGLATTAFEGWVVMLLWGALHSQAEWIPTLSYSAALWLSILASFVIGAATAKASATR